MLSAEYLAGLLDGEGSLSLARRYHRDRSTEYSVRVAVYNCDRPVLEAVQKSWGGHLASVGPRHPEWREAHSLIWTNSAAAGVLRALAPHLRVKARHAAALLRFQAHVTESARSRDPAGRLLPITRREQRIRAQFHAQLKSMNRRGSPVRSWGKSRPNSSGDKARISGEYLAGFVDAEGSLMIAKFRAASPGRWHYRARASLKGNSKDLRRNSFQAAPQEVSLARGVQIGLDRGSDGAPPASDLASPSRQEETGGTSSPVYPT